MFRVSDPHWAAPELAGAASRAVRARGESRNPCSAIGKGCVVRWEWVWQTRPAFAISFSTHPLRHAHPDVQIGVHHV